MKRVQAACICQTLHFQLNEDLGENLAVKKVEEEVALYKERLQRKGLKHKIVLEETQPDGSVIIKIIKQYNSSPVGEYLN